MRHDPPKHQKSHDDGQASPKKMGRLHDIPTIEPGTPYPTQEKSDAGTPPNPTETSRIPAPLPLGTDTGAGESEEDIETRLAYESLVKHRKQRRRKRIITVCVIVGILVVAGIAWAVATTSQNSAGNEDIGTPTTTVVRQNFEESVTASGAVKPISSVAVTPEVEGIIDTVSVAEGDAVSAGQQLFTIRNDALDKAIRDADISLRGAKNDAATAWETYQAARKAYNNGNFTDDEEGGQTAAEKASQAKSAMNEASIAYESASLALETAQSAYDEAVANGNKRTVTAPIAGNVVSMSAVEGASTSASQNGSLMQIADISQMSVTVQVNELDISKVTVGQAATVTFSALPDVSLDATVTHIASVATGDSSDYSGYGVVTYAVDLVIPEPDPQLKPGMTASVSIKMQSVPDALCVPTSALVAGDDGTYYLDVVTDQETGEIEEREVTVVAQSSTTAVVEGDIQEGDVVQMLGWASGSTDTDGIDMGTASSSSSASAETAA